MNGQSKPRGSTPDNQPSKIPLPNLNTAETFQNQQPDTGIIIRNGSSPRTTGLRNITSSSPVPLIPKTRDLGPYSSHERQRFQRPELSTPPTPPSLIGKPSTIPQVNVTAASRQTETPPPKKDTPAKSPASTSSKQKDFPPPPSTILDKKSSESYTLGAFLGEGGFARCYEVHDNQGRRLAAKVVPKQSLKGSKQKHKLLGEIHIHQMLSHPNIVKFIHVFEDDDHVYLILEFCENKTLVDLVRKRKRLLEHEVRFVMSQMLSAVQYMHKTRVIHRDLKLGNLMLSSDMHIKIGDFGLAAILQHDGERKKTICGTPNYIAPEVLFDTQNGHSYEVDIWSLGVIMYTLLVGKPPFQTKDVKAIYKRIKENNYDFPPEIRMSNEAKSLITSLLHTKPECRPALEDIISHPFFSSGRSSPPTLSPPKSLPLRQELIPNVNPEHHPSTIALAAEPSPSLHSQQHKPHSPVNSENIPTYEIEDNDTKNNAKTKSPKGINYRPATNTSPQLNNVDEQFKAMQNDIDQLQIRNEVNEDLCNGVSKTTVESQMSISSSTPQATSLVQTRPLTQAIHMDIDSPHERRNTTHASSPSSLSAQFMQSVRNTSPSIHDMQSVRTNPSSASPQTMQSIRNSLLTSPSQGSPMQISSPLTARQTLLQRQRPSPLGLGFGIESGLRRMSINETVQSNNRGFRPSPPLASATLTTSVQPQSLSQQKSNFELWQQREIWEKQQREFLERQQQLEREKEKKSCDSKPDLKIIEGKQNDQDRNACKDVKENQQDTLISQRDEQQQRSDNVRKEAQKQPASPTESQLKNYGDQKETHRHREGSGKYKTSQVLEVMYRNIVESLDQQRKGELGYKSRPLEQRNSDMYVTRWMDYTAKYGITYQLRDGSIGVYFNDSTSMILAANKMDFEYLFYEQLTGSEKTGLSREQYSLNSFPPAIAKKVSLLRHFKKYMEEKVVLDEDAPLNLNTEKTKDLDFLAKYAKTKHGVVFRMNNQVFQLNINDHTKLIIHPDAYSITYIDKHRNVYYHTLDDVAQYVSDPKPEPQHLKDIATRLKYAKDVILSMIQKRRNNDVQVE